MVSGCGAAHTIVVVVCDPEPTCYSLRPGSEGQVGGADMVRLVRQLLTRSTPITCCNLQGLCDDTPAALCLHITCLQARCAACLRLVQSCPRLMP